MYILGLGFVIGAILGSFAKAIADRSLTKRSFWGRSYCVSCKKKLNWYDLFPIFSYIFLRGKCRYCHKSIGIEYLLVEIVMGAMVGLLFYQQAANFQFTIFNSQSINNYQSSIIILDLIFKTFFITILVALFLTDLKKMLIPDRIVIPAIWISIIFVTVITIIKIIYLYYYLSQTFLGKLLLPPHTDYFQRHALLAARPLFGDILSGILISSCFMMLIKITRGRGMGGGDVKLGALIGFALGFPASVVALITAFLSGACFSLMLVATGRKNFKSEIPFGPFLVSGSLIALFWGDRLINWYLRL